MRSNFTRRISGESRCSEYSSPCFPQHRCSWPKAPRSSLPDTGVHRSGRREVGGAGRPCPQARQRNGLLKGALPMPVQYPPTIPRAPLQSLKRILKRTATMKTPRRYRERCPTNGLESYLAVRHVIPYFCQHAAHYLGRPPGLYNLRRGITASETATQILRA